MSTYQSALTALLGSAFLLAMPPSEVRALDTAEIAHQFIHYWQTGDTTSMYALLTKDYQTDWRFDDFSKFWPEKPLEIAKGTESVEQSKSGAKYHCQLIGPTAVWQLELLFTARRKIASLLVTTGGADYPYPSSNENVALPYRFQFPFSPGTGPWRIFSKNHMTFRSQRFAYDMVIIKGDRTWSGNQSENRSYFAYGTPVRSPATGTVVEVATDEPDNAPGERHFKNTAGNHVVLRVDKDVYMLLAHFQPRSVHVAVGDVVREGEIIGIVGNSGNSSEPHLHVHAFSKMPMETGDGYPLYFDNILINGHPKDRALAQNGDTLQST